MEDQKKRKLLITMIMSSLHFYSMKEAVIKLAKNPRKIKLTAHRLLLMNTRRIENSVFAAV